MFLDNGQVNMFAVMRELVRQKYPRRSTPSILGRWTSTASAVRYRSQYPGGGGFFGEIYNVGYTRAMLQAALT